MAFRITTKEDGKVTGAFVSNGPLRVLYTRETPDYSEYTGGDPSRVRIVAPPHDVNLWCSDESEIEIEWQP